MTSPRRPASARPRDEDQSEMASPTRAELEVIERQLNEISHIRWPSLIVCDGLPVPAELPASPQQAGWQLITGEQVLVARHPPDVPHLEPDIRIEAVTRASVAECVELETQVFGLLPDDRSDRAQRLAAAIEAGRLRAFLVRHRGESVASARLIVGNPAEPEPVAGLHGIGVIEGQRGRGYGRLVTAVATRAGLASSHRLIWLSVDPGNEVALILYRSLGFTPAFAWTRWLAPTAD